MNLTSNTTLPYFLAAPPKLGKLFKSLFPRGSRIARKNLSPNFYVQNKYAIAHRSSSYTKDVGRLWTSSGQSTKLQLCSSAVQVIRKFINILVLGSSQYSRWAIECGWGVRRAPRFTKHSSSQPSQHYALLGSVTRPGAGNGADNWRYKFSSDPSFKTCRKLWPPWQSNGRLVEFKKSNSAITSIWCCAGLRVSSSSVHHFGPSCRLPGGIGNLYNSSLHQIWHNTSKF